MLSHNMANTDAGLQAAR